VTGRTTPAQLPPGEDAPPPGTRIGRFIVIETLGMGGMGLVLSAYDPALDRKVAIKLLRPGLGGTETVDKRTARLLREAQAMAKIAHRNVIAVHEVGTFEGQVFLAMEYVDGEPLAAWLSTRRSPREIIAKFIAAARGLEAAHCPGGSAAPGAARGRRAQR